MSDNDIFHGGSDPEDTIDIITLLYSRNNNNNYSLNGTI